MATTITTLPDMERLMTVSDSVEVAAAPEAIWAQLADPAQMPRWSPENTGAPYGAGEPLEVGAVFHGTNKRGPARWITECKVTDSEPGRRFAFNVYALGLKKPWLRYKIAHWDYTLEPVGSGTRITETWTDGRDRWPDWSARVFDKFATGTTFHQFQQRNIARTLKHLKADFEG